MKWVCVAEVRGAAALHQHQVQLVTEVPLQTRDYCLDFPIISLATSLTCVKRCLYCLYLASGQSSNKTLLREQKWHQRFHRFLCSLINSGHCCSWFDGSRHQNTFAHADFKSKSVYCPLADTDSSYSTRTTTSAHLELKKKKKKVNN